MHMPHSCHSCTHTHTHTHTYTHIHTHTSQQKPGPDCRSECFIQQSLTRTHHNTHTHTHTHTHSLSLTLSLYLHSAHIITTISVTIPLLCHAAQQSNYICCSLTTRSEERRV